MEIEPTTSTDRFDTKHLESMGDCDFLALFVDLTVDKILKCFNL